MSYNFKGKKVLVTGAGKGIGRGVCKALYAAGAEVYALSRTQSTLDSLKVECPDIHTVCCDASRWDETRSAVEAVGPVHFLVNNAGTNILQSFLDVTPDAYDQIMDINVKSVINISQVVAKTMIAEGIEGSIVNVSSQASQRAIQDHTVYCASKGALDQLTRVMGLELGPHKIRVNAVNPTVVLTELGKEAWSDPNKAQPLLDKIMLHKFAEVKDVVDPVLFLLSDQSAMIHGATIPIEGGMWAN